MNFALQENNAILKQQVAQGQLTLSLIALIRVAVLQVSLSQAGSGHLVSQWRIHTVVPTINGVRAV